MSRENYISTVLAAAVMKAVDEYEPEFFECEDANYDEENHFDDN